MGIFDRYRIKREHNGPVEALIRWGRDGDAIVSLVGAAGQRDFLETDALLSRDDIRSWRVSDEETVRIETPDGRGPVPSSIQDIVGSWDVPPGRVFEVRNATIYGVRALQFDEEGNFIIGPSFRREQVLDFVKRDLVRSESQIQTGCEYLGLRSFPSTDRELETACVLVDKGDTTYHHWICQFLTLFEAIEAYRRETGRKPTLVVPTEWRSFQRQTLSLLGYDDSDVLEWSGGTLGVRRLVVPTKRYTQVNGGWKVFPASTLRWVRDQLMMAVEEDGREFSSKVYISREDTVGRRITNEDKLIDALQEFGFEPYVLSRMSMADQLRLFTGADAIVSPHGSGLTNTIFARDPQVLELQGPDCSSVKVGPHMFGLSESLDFLFGYCICEPAGKDMFADVDVVCEVLREWMDESDRATTENGQDSRNDKDGA